jgi:protein SCO1/2
MGWQRRWITLLLVGVVLAGISAGAVFGLRGSSKRPPATGVVVDRAMPKLPIRDEAGGRTSLASFRGTVVVLAPFLTLCHEVCPLTTGAFEAMKRAVARAGLGERVVFAEISVDPWRDTPARLRAFRRLTGADIRLFTGSRTELRRFWRFFGVGFWRMPEGRPADTDWLTHRRLTFDVGHVDGLFILDGRGHERVAETGTPRLGTLAPVLRGLLDDQGRRDLTHAGPGWTIQQGLDDVGYVLGRRISAAGS